MKTLDAALRSDLARGVAKLALAWRIRRTDGVTVRLTNHDQSITWQGEEFEARGAWALQKATTLAGRDNANLDVLGIVASDLIQKDDLLNGVWDDAHVEVLAFDWGRQGAPIPLVAGTIERVSLKGDAFIAELGDLISRLERPLGRVYARTCDAVLGDVRCQVNLSQPGYSGAGAIDQIVTSRDLLVSLSTPYPDGWFRHGVLISASGARYGVAADEAAGSQRRLRLDRAAQALAAGQGVSVIAGCDKQLATCTTKFANVINFRGFPHMPGPDAVLSGAGSAGGAL